MANADLYDPNLTEADPKYGHLSKYPVGHTFKNR